MAEIGGPLREVLAPQRGEILSGYLCRVAVEQGQTPYGFCEAMFKDKSFWTRDSDRGVIDRLVQKVASWSGLSLEQVQALTLRSWLDVLAPPSYAQRRASAILPWVNAVGLYHRTRRMYGLQYCPLCLRGEQVVQKTWRLSFAVQCTVHGIALRDSCPACDAPFVPHRAMGRLDMCHACGAWLTANERPMTVLAEVVTLQEAMMRTLSGTSAGLVAGGSVDLVGLRLLASVLLMRPRDEGVELELGLEPGTLDGPRLELSRWERRVAAMTALAAIVRNWPWDFLYLAQSLNLTQRRFVRARGLSAWLEMGLTELPAGRTKHWDPLHPKRPSPARRLEDTKPANWRSLRAAALLKKARSK